MQQTWGPQGVISEKESEDRLGETPLSSWRRANQKDKLQPNNNQVHIETLYVGSLASFLPLVTFRPSYVHSFMHSLVNVVNIY